MTSPLKVKIAVVREISCIFSLKPLEEDLQCLQQQEQRSPRLALLSTGPFLFLAPVTSHPMSQELGRKGNVMFFRTGTRLAQLWTLSSDTRTLAQKC